MYPKLKIFFSIVLTVKTMVIKIIRAKEKTWTKREVKLNIKSKGGIALALIGKAIRNKIKNIIFKLLFFSMKYKIMILLYNI